SKAAQVRLVQAAAGETDGELLIESGGGNLGATHVVTGTAGADAIKVPSLRLTRILDEAGVTQIDSLKIDVEGFEDRVLIGFFRDAPPRCGRARWSSSTSRKTNGSRIVSPTWSRAALRSCARHEAIRSCHGLQVRTRELAMIDHLGFSVSDYERAKAF